MDTGSISWLEVFCLLAIYAYFENFVNGSINKIININQEYGI